MAYTTINKHTDYFNTKLYTGNGTDNHGITGVGFQPDWTWIKPRNEARGNSLFDAVRGATKMLITNETSAEGTYATSLKSFDSDGFTLGTSNDVNKSSNTHVAWNWKANGQGSSNTTGTINTTYTSANTTAGFSIVKYTGNGTAGATIGHGLGVVPTCIIVKSVSATEHWQMYHQSLGATKYIELSSYAAVVTSSDRWNNTTPTSSVFSVGGHTSVNTNGTTYIAYCFAEKTGYSKISSYKGNGNANGTFVYTGFKPSFILMKRSDTGNSYDNWYIFDNKRDGFNPNNKKITPNISDAESADTSLFDLLSNGFKLRTTNSNNNGSNGNFIYMAFGQSIVGSNNIPTTAF